MTLPRRIAPLCLAGCLRGAGVPPPREVGLYPFQGATDVEPPFTIRRDVPLGCGVDALSRGLTPSADEADVAVEIDWTVDAVTGGQVGTIASTTEQPGRWPLRWDEARVPARRGRASSTKRSTASPSLQRAVEAVTAWKEGSASFRAPAPQRT
jgi:hypothetical protein